MAVSPDGGAVLDPGSGRTLGAVDPCLLVSGLRFLSPDAASPGFGIRDLR
jgi:hypothetical protein